MKKEAILILMMLASFSLVATGCGSKYMLSGTWYSDASEDTPAYIFYDDGKVEIGGDRYTYAMTDPDALQIDMDGDILDAVIDRETDEIALLDADGEVQAGLYKGQSDAAAAFAAKSNALAAAMTDALAGSWIMEDGDAEMEFYGDKCTVVSVHKDKEVKTIYQVVYPQEGRIQYVSSGSEVVAEFSVEIQGSSLVFTDEDGSATKYIRKEEAK